MSKMKLPEIALADAIGALGLTLVVVGVWVLLSPAAAVIVLGAALLLVAVILAYSSTQ